MTIEANGIASATRATSRPPNPAVVAGLREHLAHDVHVGPHTRPEDVDQVRNRPVSTRSPSALLESSSDVEEISSAADDVLPTSLAISTTLRAVS